MEIRCGLCVAWHRVEGECRAAPPTAFPARGPRDGWMPAYGWPRTREEDWCMRFSPEPSLVPQEEPCPTEG